MSKRLILLGPLLALFAFVATTEERAEAADTTPPETFIDSGPSGTLTGTTATFTFHSSETGSTFKCKLVDQDSTRTTCTSPTTYPNLTVGITYTFKVWAKDAAGNIDTTPATREFTPSDGGSTPPTDTDGDGVPDSTDQCDTQSGPAPTGCPADSGGNSDWPASDCENRITRVEDFDAEINKDLAGTATTFCVDAGTYQVSAQATLKTGDKLKGEPGTWASEGRARKPTPVVKLEGRGTDNLLGANGSGISITWVDVTGASATGNGAGAIKAGSAGSDFLVEYSRIHENASLGISNMQGTVRYSEFFKNSIAQSSLGFNGSAVKGITEYEAFGVYVHDEQGNGLWCDVGCKNSARATPGCPTGCFWVHDSVVVNSNRAGIRYENSSSEALFQNNVIRGNGITEHRGGIDIRDSQDAQVLNNILSDNNGIGVRATDSGRSDRVNLDKILVQDNDLGGDRIVTCGGPVECRGNTNVGSR